MRSCSLLVVAVAALSVGCDHLSSARPVALPAEVSGSLSSRRTFVAVLPPTGIDKMAVMVGVSVKTKDALVFASVSTARPDAADETELRKNEVDALVEQGNRVCAGAAVAYRTDYEQARGKSAPTTPLPAVETVLDGSIYRDLVDGQTIIVINTVKYTSGVMRFTTVSAVLPTTKLVDAMRAGLLEEMRLILRDARAVSL